MGHFKRRLIGLCQIVFCVGRGLAYFGCFRRFYFAISLLAHLGSVDFNKIIALPVSQY